MILTVFELIHITSSRKSEFLRKNRKGTPSCVAKSPITMEKLFPMPRSDRCRPLRNRFMQMRAKHPTYGLLRTLFAMFWLRWALAGCCYILWCASCGVQPLLLRWIVEYVRTGGDITQGLLCTLYLVLANCGYFLAITWKFHLSSRNGVSIRGLVMALSLIHI